MIELNPRYERIKSEHKLLIRFKLKAADNKIYKPDKTVNNVLQTNRTNPTLYFKYKSIIQNKLNT